MSNFMVGINIPYKLHKFRSGDIFYNLEVDKVFHKVKKNIKNLKKKKDNMTKGTKNLVPSFTE